MKSIFASLAFVFLILVAVPSHAVVVDFNAVIPGALLIEEDGFRIYSTGGTWAASPAWGAPVPGLVATSVDAYGAGLHIDRTDGQEFKLKGLTIGGDPAVGTSCTIHGMTSSNTMVFSLYPTAYGTQFFNTLESPYGDNKIRVLSIFCGTAQIGGLIGIDTIQMQLDSEVVIKAEDPNVTTDPTVCTRRMQRKGQC